MYTSKWKGLDVNVSPVFVHLKSAHTRVSTSPCDQSPEEFTRRDCSQGRVPRTVHTKCFEEQVEWTCPKNPNWFEFVGLVAGTKAPHCD